MQSLATESALGKLKGVVVGQSDYSETQIVQTNVPVKRDPSSATKKTF